MIRRTRRPALVASRLTRAAAAAVEPLEARQFLSVSLATPITTPFSTVPAGNPAAPLTADFDNDDKVDVLVAYPSPTAIDQGYVQFGKNDGFGTFALSEPVAVGVYVGKPVVGDFDGDGNLDLAIANAFEGNVAVLAGNGDGTFDAAEVFDAGISPEALAAGDVDDDGLTDLVIGNRSSNSADVYFGDASALLSRRVTLTTGTDPATVAVADFNADGFGDVLVGTSGGVGGSVGELQLFRWLPSVDSDGDSVPDTVAALSTTPTITTGPRGVATAADLNGDGIADVVVGITDDDEAEVLLNDGAGVLTLGGGSTGLDATKLALAADMDEDGDADLVTAVAGRVDVLPNDATGAFGKVAAFDAAGGSGPAVADVNADGRNDVLTITSTDGVTTGRTLNLSVGQRVGSDLSIAFVAPVDPAAVVAGDRGRVTVRVTNNGNETFKGRAPVQIALSTDATAGGDATVFETSAKLNLKPDRAKTLKLKVTWSAAEGTYTVLGLVDPSGTAGDLNLGNNVAAGGTLAIAPPFVDLTGTMTKLPATTVAASATVRPEVFVTNAGNVTASGRLTIAVFASTDNVASGDDVPLHAIEKKVKIAAGKTARVKLKFRLPETMPPGTFFVLGKLNEAGGIVESDLANNTAVGDVQLVVG